jgi:uroporphyrinogen decarboxylase
MDRLLMDMVENPEFVDSLFEAITNYNLAQLDLSLAHDIDGVWFGDDWGSQNGLIMGPALWRRYIKPCLARMYGKVKRAGKYVAIHSCGDVRAILPDLVELGCDIFNPFQPETLDLSETKDVYHGKLAFWGGLSVQTLLPHGTPEEVRVTTRALLDTLGKGGGYIAAPSHAVPPDVPAENIDAMIEVLRSQ